MPDPTTSWRLLADITLVVHAAYVAFVVLGLIAILVGGIAGWQWVRNRHFRLWHIAAIAVVVLQAWLGIVCPLTTLENMLRAKAGSAGYAGSFITHWLLAVLYWRAPPWVFTVVYTLFGSLVLISWFAIPANGTTQAREVRFARS